MCIVSLVEFIKVMIFVFFMLYTLGMTTNGQAEAPNKCVKCLDSKIFRLIILALALAAGKCFMLF